MLGRGAGEILARSSHAAFSPKEPTWLWRCRRPEAAEALAKELGVAAFPCDITDVAAIDRAVADAGAALGGLDIGINTTGWGLLKPFLETSEEDLRLMSAIQFIGPYRFFQALVRTMTSGGSIIQISSVTATIMMEDHAAYMGTKAGMDHIIRTIASEFGNRGIRANSIAPGGIADTPMSGGGLNLPAFAAAVSARDPTGTARRCQGRRRCGGLVGKRRRCFCHRTGNPC